MLFSSFVCRTAKREMCIRSDEMTVGDTDIDELEEEVNDAVYEMFGISPDD